MADRGGERNAATLAATIALYEKGVRIHRVHEVRDIRDGLAVAHILGKGTSGEQGVLSFTVGNLQINWRDILDILLVGYIFFPDHSADQGHQGSLGNLWASAHNRDVFRRRSIRIVHPELAAGKLSGIHLPCGHHPFQA